MKDSSHTAPPSSRGQLGLLFAGRDGTVVSVSNDAHILLGFDVKQIAEIIGPAALSGILEERGAGYKEVESLPPFRQAIPSVLVVWEKNFASGLLLLLSTTEFSNAAASREEILSTAAHDLKNPIGAIFGYADSLLETKAGDGLSDRQREILGRMRATSARALELVRNYQQLADLTVGRRLRAHVSTDLNAILKTVLENTWCEDSSRYEIKISLAPGTLPVAIDRVQLDRALSNLLSNAYRYTPKGETITVLTRRDDRSAIFSITNSAPVIKPEELRLLATPHFRATSSHGTSGTGLGLYIVRHIVEGAGGQVVVESEEAIGTRFSLIFPVPEKSAS